MTKLLALGVVFCSGLLFAFLYIDAAQQTKIEKTPVKSTSPTSGKQMYQEYCAVCHGKDGKGNGASGFRTESCAARPEHAREE